MTRQRRWQKRMKAEGRCIICGKPQAPYSGFYCAFHRLAHLRRVRRLTGSRPWRPGGPGRPPLQRHPEE